MSLFAIEKYVECIEDCEKAIQINPKFIKVIIYANNIDSHTFGKHKHLESS